MKLKDYVIEVLSPHEWRSTIEICDLATDAAIARNDWGPVSFLISFFSKDAAAKWMKLHSGTARLYGILKDLELEDCIEKRLRVPQTRPQRQPEYRLTSSGLRRRIDKTSKAKGELNFA